MAGTQSLSGGRCGFAPRQNTAQSSAWGATAQAALARAHTWLTWPWHQGFPLPQGRAGPAQGHPQNTVTSKRGSLPHRADHRAIRIVERCKGSRMASRARGETDPQREQAGSWGGGTYGSSRLSLLEIQTLSISCKDTQLGQRRNNLVLPCDAHLNTPTPPSVPGTMQGAPKTPNLAIGGRDWHQPWGCSTGEWLHGFAASLEMTATTLPALSGSDHPLPRYPPQSAAPAGT